VPDKPTLAEIRKRMEAPTSVLAHLHYARDVGALLELLEREQNTPCSVCAGSRVLLTGEQCRICEQTGLESREIVGLRLECYRLGRELEARLAAKDARIAELEAKLAEPACDHSWEAWSAACRGDGMSSRTDKCVKCSATMTTEFGAADEEG
jgi:hypothetical protein